MDEITLKQLKDSGYHYPVVTEVIYDNRTMLEVTIDSIKMSQIGYNTAWDSQLCSWASKYFLEGLKIAEHQIKEKGIKVQLLVEAKSENLDFLDSLELHEIRHLDGLRGNFGIFDNRAYMVFILHKEDDEPLQTFFSNSKSLVDRQNELFGKMWNMALPLSHRRKELEYEDNPGYKKTITDHNELLMEINDLVELSRKELLVISSNRLLNRLLNNDHFISKLSICLKREVTIKLLTDDTNEHFLKQIDELSIASKYNQINCGYSNKLGDINEMVIITDSKIMLRIKYDIIHGTYALLSSEEQSVLVQEILFEKYWNEIKSLEIAQSS